MTAGWDKGYVGFMDCVRIASFSGKLKLKNFKAYVLHSKIERTDEFGCANPDINRLGENALWSLKSNFVDIPTDCPC